MSLPDEPASVRLEVPEGLNAPTSATWPACGPRTTPGRTLVDGPVPARAGHQGQRDAWTGWWDSLVTDAAAGRAGGFGAPGYEVLAAAPQLRALAAGRLREALVWFSRLRDGDAVLDPRRSGGTLSGVDVGRLSGRSSCR